MEAIRKRRSELEAHREELYTSLHNIEPFLDFDYDIHSVLRFKYIRYRFGKIAKDYYEKLENMCTKTWIPYFSNATATTSISGASTLLPRADHQVGRSLLVPAL